MADKNWPRGRGEASNLSNLQIITHYLDSHYEIVEENLVRGETRLLKVFSLKPRTLGRPSFHARVDDGSAVKLKSPELDIDIDGVNDAIKADFKGNRNGYLGHHNNRSPDPQQRIFEVEIATPAGNVFQGDVFFNVAFSVGLNFTGQSSMSADATVVRASPLVRFRSCLKTLWQRIWSII